MKNFLSLLNLLFVCLFVSPVSGQEIYQAPGKFSDSVVLMDQTNNVLSADKPLWTQSREWAIARGLVVGAKPFSAYGERTSAGAETNFPIWPDGAFAIPAASGVQMALVSTSAQDTNTTGTGIWSVEIHYLDNLLAEQSTTVILNGLTPVNTTPTNIRFIQCMHIATSAGTSAAGTITASNGGVIYSQINAGATRCSSAFRMVPAGYQLRILAASASSISGTAATATQIRLVANAIGTHTYTNPLIFVPFGSTGVQDGGIGLDFPPQEAFQPGTVVGATHTSDKAATISVTWFGYLEPYP